MKARHLLVAALAAAALSGCVTYDHVGARAPGGYYSGRASTDYYYGPYGSYGYYGYPSYGYYGHGYYGYPYSRYPYYPYPSRPHHPRPPRPGDDDRDDNRPPPWRGPGNANAQPRPPAQSVRPLRPETEGRAPWRGGNAVARPVPQRTQPMARPQREVRSAPAPRRQEGASWRRPPQQREP